MANINETIAEVEKLNPELAKQLKRYVKDHSYGLVFEQNLPDSVRLWTKKPAKYDKVNILPPRGEFDTEENYKEWYVSDIVDGTATVVNGEEVKLVSAEDIVPVVGHKDVVYPGLKVIDKVERGNADDPYHMVINAENYHALEALCYAYAGKVDCIYIDPPYNTGAKDWKYNNDYVGQDDQYRHSKWLAMMERRLKLAKRLLNLADSVMIVTIDEKEYLRLGMLLEQMFPEAKIQMVSSVINPAGAVRQGEFSRTNEFIYFVMFGNAVPDKFYDNDTITAYSETLHWNTLRRTDLASARGTKKGGIAQFYPIYIDNKTHKIIDVGEALPPNVDRNTVPDREGCSTVFPVRDDGTEMNWGLIGPVLIEREKKGYVSVGSFSPDKPQKYSISYLRSGRIKDIETGKFKVTGYAPNGAVQGVYEIKRGISPTTQWERKNHDAYRCGTNIVSNILGDNRFTFPKSLYAVKDCIDLFVHNKPNALVVDFFAGSGTTAHATMLLNQMDGGHRRCIMVTNNEIGPETEEDFTKNKHLRPSDDEWQKYGIAKYITWERVKAAITGINTKGEMVQGDYLSPLYDEKEKKRNYVCLDFLKDSSDLSLNQKKQLLKMLSGGNMPQKLIQADTKYIVSEDEKHKISILFDDTAVDEWLEKLDGNDHITDFYIITKDKNLFKQISESVNDILGNIIIKEPAKIPMSEGFKENAIFCELTYENLWDIRLDRAFNAVAPILWMLAGCKGPIIEKLGKGYATTCNYAVLFKYDAVSKLVEVLKNKPSIEHVFVVTDDQQRYLNVINKLNMIKRQNIHRLYESYLRSFEIVGEGGLD